MASLWVTIAVIAKFEHLRRYVAALDGLLKGKDGEYPLVPLEAIRAIGDVTRHLNHDIGWVISVVVLVIIPYHPRMDYCPLTVHPVSFCRLAISSLTLWSYLIRRRANNAKQRAIRKLNEERRSLNDVVAGYSLPADDPWTQAVDISTHRRSTGGTRVEDPEVSTLTATKVECDYIDDEIEMIRAVDYGAYAPWYNAPGFAWLGGSAGAIALFDAMLRAAQSGF